MDLHLFTCKPMIVVRAALFVLMHPRQKLVVHQRGLLPLIWLTKMVSVGDCSLPSNFLNLGGLISGFLLRHSAYRFCARLRFSASRCSYTSVQSFILMSCTTIWCCFQVLKLRNLMSHALQLISFFGTKSGGGM